MTGAPERIWAWFFQTAEHGGWSEWGGYARRTNIHALDDRERATGAEYIRADLVAPLQITDDMVRAAHWVLLEETLSDEIIRAALTAALGAQDAR